LGLKRNWELHESKRAKNDFAHLDDWTFDAQDRHLPFAPGGEWDQTRRGCADVSGVEALSAVWPRGAGGLVRRAWHRYEHFPELGGRRKAKPDSKNTAWRNEAFRGYADYMETEDFRNGIARLVDLASEAGPTAIMCAEAVWWRCHRSLISDYLKARGVEVIHILGEKKTEPHPFTSAAQIVNGDLSYRPRSRR